MSARKRQAVALLLALACAPWARPVAGTGLSQGVPPSEPLSLMVDVARFRGDEERAWVEISYAVPERTLTYGRDAAGLTARLEMEADVLAGDSAVFTQRWNVPHSAADSARIAVMNLVGVVQVPLAPGSYMLRLTARDALAPSRLATVTLPLSVAAPARTRPVLSDIQLAARITRNAGQGSQFYKNTLEVRPSVEGVFGPGHDLYYYAEAYNLDAEGGPGEFRLRASVRDAVGRELIARDRVRRRPGESAVLVDSIGVAALPTGSYVLTLMLWGAEPAAADSSLRRFFVYNPSLGVDSTLVLLDARVPSAEYARMEDSELDREFAWLRYEASGDEKNRFEELEGADAKRRYLEDFWSRRPPGKRLVCLERVRYANTHYGFLGRHGYRSDRGRVHVVYGPPDDIERHPNEAESRPYEIWTYHAIQTGVIFVFVLRQEGGDYELVHSTHRNELQDANWQRFAVTR
ncbi:MAG: GWxTD domain-containing protein [Bacteroidota bacterium]